MPEDEADQQQTPPELDLTGDGQPFPPTDYLPPIAAEGPEAPESQPVLPFPVVGIGGSAGSTEAYIQLFQHLSATTGMAFVLIPHLAAETKSHLAEIISRFTKMRAVIMENGTRPEPDHVYILPPNVRASLQGGVFHLEARASEGVPRPIDFFFRSLAAEQKNFAIGVVLSGMDADGAVGLKTIKGEGGISIVQAPESARFPDMPRSSISADHVDMVLAPDQIAQHLAVLAQRVQSPELRRLEEGVPPPEHEGQNLTRILKLLRGISGVDFRLYKPNTLKRRIARRMLMHRIDTLADYASLLQINPKELRDLHEDVLINVTRFFRDPDVFEALKQIVFPQILEHHSPEQQIRIWVPGCSSGEEVYSIAICLLECLTGSIGEPPIQIFGTDASEIGIQKARLAIYPETIINEVSAERLRRFFMKTEKGFQISKRIRDLCIFARQNLCNDPPFSRLDLVSCRNVLIYLGTDLQKQLIPTFHYALRPDGFLLLGTSEAIRNFTDLFRLTDRKHKIFSKVGSTSTWALLDAPAHVFAPDIAPEGLNIRSSGVLSDLELQRTVDRIVLARYGPPGVVINDRLEILQFRGHTSPFLEMAHGTASLQLGRVLRDSIAPQVMAAVKRAIDYDLPVQVHDLHVRDGEHLRAITLEVLPMHIAGARSKWFLVSFVPRQEFSAGELAPALEPPLAEGKEEDKDRLIARFRHDLSSTKLYLQTLLEERDAKNQELVSANEEIQSANEELQSTNEELETTKEELQSSNEELQTVNDELQNRNAILTQASNDLQNLLNSVNLPLLMLSSGFSIRHFTPQTQRLMNVRATDVGRPFSDIRLNLDIDNLEPLFTEVLDTLAPREIEVQDRDGHWYLLRVRPYRTTDNKIDGLVLVLVDIDQLRRSQQELRNARDFARSVIESIPLPLVVVDSNFRIHSANQAFCMLTASTSQALERRFLPDLATALWGMEDQLRAFLERMRDNKSGNHFEFEHKTPEDRARVFLVRGRPLKPDGERFLLITFEDITPHREVERLLEAERERLASTVESTTKELDRSREELRALTGSLMASQEEERRRVARELHDDISQRLAAINIECDAALNSITQDPAASKQKLEQNLARMAELSEDVRVLSHSLHPSIIEHLGLPAALRSLTEEFGEREEMITTFFAEDAPPSLPVEAATGLYRIAQEALRNIAKHAGKTHVKVQLTGVPGGVELRISDAGKGFDVEQKRSGLGLISMQERARLMHGAVKIESVLRQGTWVTVHVPLKAETETAQTESRA